MRVLIVDPSSENRQFLKNLLSGHDCLGVGDGERAILKAGQGRYDLIILDLAVKDPGGGCLLKRLKEQGIFIPVITLSPDRGILNSRLCERYGVYAFVATPILDQQAFRHIIETLQKTSETVNPWTSEAPERTAVQTRLSPQTVETAGQTASRVCTAPPPWMRIEHARHAVNN